MVLLNKKFSEELNACLEKNIKGKLKTQNLLPFIIYNSIVLLRVRQQESGFLESQFQMYTQSMILQIG